MIWQLFHNWFLPQFMVVWVIIEKLSHWDNAVAYNIFQVAAETDFLLS
jgi:hypothetical protein